MTISSYHHYILGPHLAYSGRSILEVFPDSVLTNDENFKLHFNLHDSIESQVWLNAKQKASHPVCTYNSGYISGT